MFVVVCCLFVVVVVCCLFVVVDLCIDGLEHKVCPNTQRSIFHDEFFRDQDIVVNALDNVAARRHVDRWVWHGGAVVEV